MPGGKKIEKSKQPVEKYESQFSKYKIGPEGESIFFDRFGPDRLSGDSSLGRYTGKDPVFRALACPSSEKYENVIFS